MGGEVGGLTYKATGFLLTFFFASEKLVLCEIF